MREKAKKFVYFNTGRYISYDFLKNFYWYIVIIPFFMIVMGIYLIKQNGISYKSLFPLVSISIWTLLYWGMFLSISSKRSKKTFELRFLVNGIVGVMISSLIWSFFASWNLMADKPFLSFRAFLCMIPVYILASVMYIASIVVGVHKGIYVRKKMKGKTIAFVSTSVSIVGGFGLISSRLLRETVSLKCQHLFITIVCTLLIFIPILAHINFLKYLYCKKYNIKCDEDGKTISILLYPNSEDNNTHHKNKSQWNTTKRFVFILLFVITTIFLVFCIESFIKGFLQGII